MEMMWQGWGKRGFRGFKGSKGLKGDGLRVQGSGRRASGTLRTIPIPGGVRGG
jgi:hypothetical protein